MEIKTYALVDENNVVINTILWDGEVELGLDGQLIEFTEENPAYIGGLFVDGQFFPAEEVETTTTVTDAEQ